MWSQGKTEKPKRMLIKQGSTTAQETLSTRQAAGGRSQHVKPQAMVAQRLSVTGCWQPAVGRWAACWEQPEKAMPVGRAGMTPGLAAKPPLAALGSPALAGNQTAGT